MTMALGLVGYNLWTAGAAGKRAESVTAQLVKAIPAASAAPIPSLEEEICYPDYVLTPHMDMSAQEVDGLVCIGLLEIPAIGLELPVQKEWSYSDLRASPCRYEGTVYFDNMVICGHNYSSHFGALKELNEGDGVFFTDMDGNRFSYRVKETEILPPGAVEEMTTGDWELTLFTCTFGGASRVTVRCSRIAE